MASATVGAATIRARFINKALRKAHVQRLERGRQLHEGSSHRAQCKGQLVTTEAEHNMWGHSTEVGGHIEHR